MTSTAPGSRKRFDPWATAAYALLWLALVVHGWGPLLDHDPAAWLHYPESSAERMTVRDLELAGAVEDTSDFVRRVIGPLYGTREDLLYSGIEVHEQVLGTLAEADLPPGAVPVRLALLLTEAGETEEAVALLREREENRDLGEILARVQASGVDPGEVDALVETFAFAGLSPGYLDLAEAHIARGAGDAERAAAAEARTRARGERWKRRSFALLASNVALGLFGAVFALTGLRSFRRLLAGAGDPPPWSFEDGIGVFVRGDFWNRLYYVVLYVGLPKLESQPMIADLADTAVVGLLQTWGTLFASLPLLWLVHRRLLAPAGQSWGRALGLAPGLGQVRTVLGVALAAIAVDLVGTHALRWSTWGLGVSSSWAEGFDEMLVWGSPGEALLTTTDYVLWTPAFEELAFRGVLYFSLRARLGPASAALLTAGFFSALHFYSLPGFLMTMWSGLVWALAFERARSLLPGIAAHAVYNGLYVAGLMLLYR